MNNLLQAPVKDLLDTLLADVRPLPSERALRDFSYLLNSDALILQKHVRALDTEMLVTHPSMAFTTELADVMAAARFVAGITQHPLSFDMAV